MEGEDPVTVAMAATAASAAVSAGAGIMGGINANKAAGSQAEQLKRQAQLELQAAGAKQGGEDTEAIRATGKLVAAASASGITPESADPVLSEDVSQQKIRDAYTRYSGKLASTNDLYQASIAKWQGKQALIGGFMGAAQSVLGAAAGIGNIKSAGGWGSSTGTSYSGDSVGS